MVGKNERFDERIKAFTMKLLKGKVSEFLDRLTEKKQFISSPINRNDRVGMLHHCWGYAFTNLLKGAYYEFGVYQGSTLLESWKVYLNYRKWAESQLVSPEPWRRETMKGYIDYQHFFYGFDTFEGIPSNGEKNETFAKGTFLASLDAVKKKCLDKKMEVQLFKGLFSDIADESMADLQPAAIINIDSDLYASAKDALEKVRMKIQQGTILLLDDYNCFSADSAKGERRALKEFCAKYPQFRFEPWFVYSYVGQAFICHLN